MRGTFNNSLQEAIDFYLCLFAHIRFLIKIVQSPNSSKYPLYIFNDKSIDSFSGLKLLYFRQFAWFIIVANFMNINLSFIISPGVAFTLLYI